MKKILILNGPNLNLLGKREKTIYGEISFEEYFLKIKEKYNSIKIEYFQSNDEAEIIRKIHEVEVNYDGLIFNPAAFGHTSIAIADAVAGISKPCIEVHISNIYAREHFRHYTLLSAKCAGTISGFGLKSYDLALEYFL